MHSCMGASTTYNKKMHDELLKGNLVFIKYGFLIKHYRLFFMNENKIIYMNLSKESSGNNWSENVPVLTFCEHDWIANSYNRTFLLEEFKIKEQREIEKRLNSAFESNKTLKKLLDNSLFDSI